MAHLHRFFVPRETPDAGEVGLPPEEAHHAQRVVRLRNGDAVRLFDGQGRELEAVAVDANRRAVTVRIEAVRRVPRPTRALTLALAWLHKDKPMEEVVRRGTELGVDRFHFFRAARSERTPRIPGKWTRLAIEACKQCGRLWLPDFEAAEDLAPVLAAAGGDGLVMTMGRTPVPLARALTGRDVTLLVGPEGDFTEAELDAALARGFRPVSLGDTTFRTEVAAVLAAALVRYATGGLGPLA